MSSRAPAAKPTRRTTPRGGTNATPPSTAGGSSRKAKAQAAADASWTLPGLPDSILQRPPERWVCVHFKLQHVSLLDDVVRLPPNATLHTLEAKLMAHHGGAVKGIELYKDDTQPKNKLRDFSLSLKDAFHLDDARPATVPFPNIPSSSGVGPPMVLSPEDHHVTVCYDFKSHDSDCPLLNRSPRYRSGAVLDGSASGGGGGAGHSSLSRSAAASGGGAASSSAAGGAGGAAANSPAGSTAAGNQSSTTQQSAGAAGGGGGGSAGGIGLSAPLSVSGADGSTSGTGVGAGGPNSGRGSTKS